MGRTNPTFRRYLRRFRERWQPFRRALRAPQQVRFDALLAGADRFAAAAGQQNAHDPDRAILLSMLLAHQVALEELETRVEGVEAASASVGDAVPSTPRSDGPPDG